MECFRFFFHFFLINSSIQKAHKCFPPRTLGNKKIGFTSFRIGLHFSTIAYTGRSIETIYPKKILKITKDANKPTTIKNQNEWKSCQENRWNSTLTEKQYKGSFVVALLLKIAPRGGFSHINFSDWRKQPGKQLERHSEHSGITGRQGTTGTVAVEKSCRFWYEHKGERKESNFMECNWRTEWRGRRTTMGVKRCVIEDGRKTPVQKYHS